MSYVERNLAPGETIVYRARYHWIYYGTALLLLFFAFLLGLSALYAAQVSPDPQVPRIVAFMGLGFLVLSLVSFLVRRIRAASDEYVVTNRRVVRKYGFVAREVEQALLERIQDVTLRQGVTARLLGYGTVEVETASESGRLVFPKIANPEGFRTALWNQAAVPGRGAAASGTVAPASGTVTPAMTSPRERLAQLEELKSRGLLTGEEYAAKREEILSGL